MTMKSLTLFCFLFCSALVSYAQKSFNDGVLRYEIIDEEEKTCELTGPMSKKINGDLVIKEEVMTENESYKVVSIATYAFNECELSSVTVPKTVTQIGYGPFSSNDPLKEINVDPENPVYCSLDGCLYTKNLDTIIQCPGGLESVSLPASLTKILDQSFNGCSLLTSVEIPESVTYIGTYAFAGCSSLKSIKIPEGMTFIMGNAFCSCSGLEKVEFPSSLQYVGPHSFSGCESLTSIVLPASVYAIGEGAFSGCYSLNSVTLLTDKYISLVYEKFETPQFNVISKDARLYVKEELIDEYKKSEWTRYFLEILPIGENTKTVAMKEIEVDATIPFEIYNLSGQIIKKKASKENLNSLVPGVYILRQGNASKKIRIK